MGDNFTGQQIRRCNRNLLIANLVLVDAVITCATINACNLGTEDGWWTLGISSPLLLLAGWNLSKWKKRARDYASHSIYTRLACLRTASSGLDRRKGQ
jgi:hypothetical protein